MIKKLLIFLALGASLAFGQGTKYQFYAVDRTGKPIQYVDVFVCTQGSTGSLSSSPPCSPEVTIYQDRGLTQPITQPVVGDGNGNYLFYIANPQTVDLVFESPSITTYKQTDVVIPNGALNQGALNATTFSGADIGAQINNAYAALPAVGGVITIPPAPSGGCWSESTTVNVTTVGKPAKLLGTPGACIDYTGTGPGFVFDWGQTGGNYLHLIGGGLDTLTILCGNASNTTCVSIGPTNNAEGYLITNSKITGFASNAVVDINSSGGAKSSFAGLISNSYIFGNAWTSAACVQLHTFNERVNFDSDVISSCIVGIKGANVSGTDTYVHKTSIDDNLTGITYISGTLDLVDVHFENSSGLGGAPMLNLNTGGDAVVTVYGGLWLNDDSNAGHTDTQLWTVQSTGTNLIMDGTQVFSAGTIIPQVINVLVPSPNTTARINIARTSSAVQNDINSGFNSSSGQFLDIPGTLSGQPIVTGAIQTQTNLNGGGCNGWAFDLFDVNTSMHKFWRNNAGTLEITNAACSQVQFRQFDTGGISIHGATPGAEPGGIGLGSTVGFGAGSAGTAVTTTTKGGGTGPTTPQTVVNYIEINIGGTNYWVPLVQ